MKHTKFHLLNAKSASQSEAETMSVRSNNEPKDELLKKLAKKWGGVFYKFLTHFGQWSNPAC